jgi:hypothetical protein
MTIDAEARMAELQAQVVERVLRERDAQRMVLQRAGVSLKDLETTQRVLMDLGRVNLSDLCVPPGFNLLADGSVGSVNERTPEWQRWSTASQFADDCQHVGAVLARFA